MDFLARFARHPVIIAELGGKYGGMEVVERSIRAAAAAGSDLIKVQTFRADTIAAPGATFTFEDGRVVSQHEFFSAAELDLEDHERIDALCREVGVGWISTPSHPDDVALLERFSPLAYKTGSDDLTNLPFLRHIAERGRPMIVSTGMCSLAEVAAAVETIVATGNDQLILLHCVVSYPSRVEDANLRAIETLRRAFGFPVGLSDHTTDELTSVLATSLGACVIEKHFTIDYALRLPDHQASLDPPRWERLVGRVRAVGPALGDGVKRILGTEEKWRRAARKSLFSARAIDVGERIGADDIDIRRPADGIHPHHRDLFVGRAARTRIEAGTLLDWSIV
ncbi:MAG: N-acetylneuraminate synthase family protein [Myxococcota bacterium]